MQDSDRLNPWLEDGNVVLAVEGKYFRVHRSILGSYSEVFRDMFTCPHSGANETELIDECPVIHLHDAVADVEIMLKALYDRSFVFFHDIQMPFPVLAAFLRLGKKYAIRQLFEEATKRLFSNSPSLAFASGVSATLKKTLFPSISGYDPYNFMIMDVAHEVGLMSTVAMAAFYCSVACPAKTIIDGYDFNDTKCTLSFPNQRLCFLAQEYIHDVERQLSLCLASPGTSCVRGGYGVDRNPCIFGLHYAVNCIRAFRQPFQSWMRDWDSRLCTNCKVELEKKYEETRVRLWRDMPQRLDLDCWENLDIEVDLS